MQKPPIYRHVIIITETDYHAVEHDGRWEIYDNDRLFAFADNKPIALAKIEDVFIELGGELQEDRTE